MLYGATEPGPVTYLQGMLCLVCSHIYCFTTFYHSEKTWPEGYDWFKLPTTTEPAFLPYHTETNTFELVFKVFYSPYPSATLFHNIHLGDRGTSSWRYQYSH